MGCFDKYDPKRTRWRVFHVGHRKERKDTLKIHRCIQEGRKRKNDGTLSFCTGLDCWGNAWLAASNRIEDDGRCYGMVVVSTAVVLLPC